MSGEDPERSSSPGAAGEEEPPISVGPETVALLESLQRAAPVGHVLFDAEGRYLRVNDAALAMNGGTRAERIGRSIAEVQPALAPAVLASIREVVATRTVRAGRRLEATTAAAPEDRRIWQGTYYPVTGRDGTLYGVGCIFEDVTEAELSARHVRVVGSVTAALLPATSIAEVAAVALTTVPALLGATDALLVVGGPGSSAERRVGRLARTSAGARLEWSALDGPLAALAEEVAAGGPLVVDPPAPMSPAGPGGAPGRAVVLHLGSDAGAAAALVLSFPEGTHLGEAHLRLLSAVADQCTVARERARSIEEAAAASRLTVRLQHATARLADATSVEQIAKVVVEEAMAGLGASGGGLGLLDPTGRTHRFVTHTGWEELERLGILGDRPLDQPSLSAVALRRRAPVTVARADELARYMPPERARAVAAIGLRQAWAVYPLFGARGPVGTLALSFPSSWNFTDRERAFVYSLAGQAAAAVDRVRRQQADHEVASVLQRALLPERLPTVAGCTLAVRYLAGADGIQVGGDWYDAFELEDGRLALVIGDVAGHDLAAAGAMGHLRAQLRACARHDLGPGATLSELDRLVHRLSHDDERFATLVYATWRPGTGYLELALAGHLPPLCCGPRGAELVELAPGPPLGAALGPASYEDHQLDLPPEGATVVLFTDGLVERPGRHLGEGLEQLHRAARRWCDAEPDLLADGLLELLRPAGGWLDDVALLACRIDPGPLRA